MCSQSLLTKIENNKINRSILCSIAQSFKIKCVKLTHFKLKRILAENLVYIQHNILISYYY